MSEGTILERLRQIHFLADVEEERLKQIAAAAKIVEFPAGKVVFREGQTLADIYLILSGSVSLEICAPGIGCKRIMTISQGDLLGISPVLEQSHSTATARTTSPTEVIQLNASQILTMCEHDPRFGYEFMKRAALAITQRLSATRLQLIDIYGGQLPNVPDNEG